MSIEETTVYTTNDGVHHRDIEAAEKHIINECCPIFDEAIKGIVSESGVPIFTRYDEYRIVTAICDNLPKLEKLYLALGKYLD